MAKNSESKNSPTRKTLANTTSRPTFGEDILEDWRLTKPILVPSAEKEDWKLLEDYVWNLTDSKYQELSDNRNKLYEADDVANILRSISRLSDVGRATLNKLLDNGSKDVENEYTEQWNRIVPLRQADGEEE